MNNSNQQQGIEIERTLLAKKLKDGCDKEVVKTSETPQVLTPIERAKKLIRKMDDKYSSYISSKTLTGIDK